MEQTTTNSNCYRETTSLMFNKNSSDLEFIDFFNKEIREYLAAGWVLFNFERKVTGTMPEKIRLNFQRYVTIDESPNDF